MKHYRSRSPSLAPDTTWQVIPGVGWGSIGSSHPHPQSQGHRGLPTLHGLAMVIQEGKPGWREVSTGKERGLVITRTKVYSITNGDGNWWTTKLKVTLSEWNRSKAYSDASATLPGPSQLSVLEYTLRAYISAHRRVEMEQLIPQGSPN